MWNLLHYGIRLYPARFETGNDYFVMIKSGNGAHEYILHVTLHVRVLPFYPYRHYDGHPLGYHPYSHILRSHPLALLFSLRIVGDI